MAKNPPAVIAMLYDFDKTLCTKNMQEYSFIPRLGISDDRSLNRYQPDESCRIPFRNMIYIAAADYTETDELASLTRDIVSEMVIEDGLVELHRRQMREAKK
ncbi:hypothetical protein LJC31_06410 [Synergistaceae bacterium OttesenSCG-928-I11]|nr:hypothetical protein [Synergistaceae bacterium OttesenSCG-928-I11]